MALAYLEPGTDFLLLLLRCRLARLARSVCDPANQRGVQADEGLFVGSFARVCPEGEFELILFVIGVSSIRVRESRFGI